MSVRTSTSASMSVSTCKDSPPAHHLVSNYVRSGGHPSRATTVRRILDREHACTCLLSFFFAQQVVIVLCVSLLMLIMSMLTIMIMMTILMMELMMILMMEAERDNDHKKDHFAADGAAPDASLVANMNEP